MQIHNFKIKTKNKKHRQRGRGGKRGTTSGRGTKGQKARAGRKLRPELRDIIKKIPKARGYRFKSISLKPAVVNLSDLQEAYQNGETVTAVSITQKGLIRKMGGKARLVKILGGGTIKKALKISGVAVSSSAKAAIEKAGGSVA